MKIPTTIPQDVIDHLEKIGNCVVIPKYPGYQHLNNEMLKYYYFPSIVYLKEDNTWYILNEDDEQANQLIPNYAKLYKETYVKLNKKEKELFRLLRAFQKIPKWIRKFYGA